MEAVPTRMVTQRTSVALIVLGGVLSLVPLVTGTSPVGSAVAIVVGLGALVAQVVGVRRNRPEGRTWYLAVASLALYLAAGLVRLVAPAGGLAPLPDAIALAGYGAQGVFLVRLGSGVRRSARWTVAGDALTIAVATWALMFPLVFLPSVRSEGDAVTGLVGSLYQPAGVVLIFLVIRLVSGEPARLPAYWLLVVAVVASLAGDLGYALSAARIVDVDPGRFDACYGLACVGIGGAALHPSMRVLGRAGRQPGGASGRGRAAVVTATMALPAIVLLAVHPADATVRTTVALGCLAVAVLAGARMWVALAQERRVVAGLAHAARHDDLTGLPNRSALVEAIDRAVAGRWTGRARPAVLFVDLDRFKQVNDSLGHHAGDELLQWVSARLVATVAGGGIVGRVAGDEFVVVVPHVAAESEAIALGERLLVCLDEPIPLGQGDVFVTASIGVSVAEAVGPVDAEELLRRADTAMYEAKAAGRSRLVVFDASMQEQVARRLELETALHRALDRGELEPYYQAIVEIETGRLTGFEVLMRWNRPGHGMVSPAEFIPIAEETGLIVPIGAWILEQSLAHLRRWIDTGIVPESTTMSVNVSPRQFRDDSLVPTVVQALGRSGIRADQLWLEITEGVVIDEPERMMVTLDRLRAVGVRIAMDDFGTGYSSLSYLKRLPIQRIKIDRAFVRTLEHDADDRVLVAAIVALGTSLGKDLVAEGVETTAQAEILRNLGCPKAQGFLFSKPAPAPAIEERGRAQDAGVVAPVDPVATG